MTSTISKLDECERDESLKGQDSMRRASGDLLSKLAAAYVRASTEHQQYSTNNQLDVIRQYAERRGLEITKIYSDARLQLASIHSAVSPAGTRPHRLRAIRVSAFCWLCCDRRRNWSRSAAEGG